MEPKIIDINYRSIEAYIEGRRPAVEMREQLDYGFKLEGNTYELFSIRPIYGRKGEYIRSSFAKIKYVKTQEKWKLFWMRASGKWQSYEPLAESNFIRTIISCIEEDVHGCFFG